MTTCLLQEDNDPIRTSKLARAWRERHGVVSMPLPAQSPDQNPIENVWMLVGSMKAVLEAKGDYTIY